MATDFPVRGQLVGGAEEVGAAGVGVDGLEGVGDDLDLRHTPCGIGQPGFASVLSDQLVAFRVVGRKLVQLGVEALLQEVLDGVAESGPAFVGCRHEDPLVLLFRKPERDCIPVLPLIKRCDWC
ncbi:hypothetical protein SDC9_182504 [bioreactor metagenome]|uniref:Uncharacterized protein n=1 Tax=bioreactor metagenome TaxID=1076179 RepID=A0A645H8I7_9ZZZZ